MRPRRPFALCSVRSLVLVLVVPALAHAICFEAHPVHQDGGPVYGLIWGEFDPDHPGCECAYLAVDGSVIECRPDGHPWSPILIYQGDDPILLMDQRPTLSWGDVQASHVGAEIVVFAHDQLNAIHRTPSGEWSHARLFDTTGMVGSGWGARVGDYHPGFDGLEILMIFEGVLDSSTGTIYAEVAGAWRDTIVYMDEVGMDSAAGEFDPDHDGPEFVIATEMGPTYEITAPEPMAGGLARSGASGSARAELRDDYWPKRMIWRDYEYAGWVVEIGEVDPVHPGNEIAYGTRYSNSILVSGHAGSGWHEYEVVFTGTTTEIPRDMWDIDLGDVLPEVPGQEIVGVDNSGNVYLVWHDGGWQGETVWTDHEGPLYAVIADEIDPAALGDEILVAGASGTFTVLTRVTTEVPGGTPVGGGGSGAAITLGAHPNPAARGVRIAVRFGGESGGDVVIYDVAGSVVRRLGSVPPGRHDLTWDGRDDSGERAACGVYWCTLTCDGRHASTPIVLVR